MEYDDLPPLLRNLRRYARARCAAGQQVPTMLRTGQATPAPVRDADADGRGFFGSQAGEIAQAPL